MTELVAQPDPVREPLPLFLDDEPIVGWRLWRVELHAGDPGDGIAVTRPRLASVGKPTTWLPRQELHGICYPARCPCEFCQTRGGRAPAEHRSPWPDGNCACGIWAFKEPADPLAALWVYGVRSEPSVLVAWALGSVKLWGRVVECTNGYRGEYAYPQTLQVIDADYVRTIQLESDDRDSHRRARRDGRDLRYLLQPLAATLASEYGIVATPMLPPPLPTPSDLERRQRAGLLTPPLLLLQTTHVGLMAVAGPILRRERRRRRLRALLALGCLLALLGAASGAASHDLLHLIVGLVELAVCALFRLRLRR